MINISFEDYPMNLKARDPFLTSNLTDEESTILIFSSFLTMRLAIALRLDTDMETASIMASLHKIRNPNRYHSRIGERHLPRSL